MDEQEKLGEQGIIQTLQQMSLKEWKEKTWGKRTGQKKGKVTTIR
jgi:hypothetical protein